MDFITKRLYTNKVYDRDIYLYCNEKDAVADFLFREVNKTLYNLPTPIDFSSNFKTIVRVDI